jgi:hypothetical protein
MRIWNIGIYTRQYVGYRSMFIMAYQLVEEGGGGAFSRGNSVGRV